MFMNFREQVVKIDYERSCHKYRAGCTCEHPLKMAGTKYASAKKHSVSEKGIY